MSKKSKKRTSARESGPFAGLYSRHILRAVVEALDLGEGHVLTGRTARRFLRNSEPNGHNRGEFFLALGQTLIDMGFVPDLEPHLPMQVSSAQAYGDVVQLACRRWDAFMSTIQSEGSWDVDMAAAARCFVGLAAVDLGLRLCGLNWLTGMNVRLDEIPLWAEENGIGKILRSRLSEAGLTRDQLAARLEVWDTTVDNWLDGRNWPSREYVDPLAREFAVGDPELAVPLATELRRRFALAKLCHLLSEHLGWDYVYSAVDAVSSFARDLSEQVATRLAPEANRQSLAATLFAKGSDFLEVMYILQLLAAGYPDGEWRDAILGAAMPWELAYGKARKSGETAKSDAAGLAQDYLDVVDVSDIADALAVREAITGALALEMNALVASGPLPLLERHPLSLLEDGIAVRRQLVERFPASPETHQHLGSYLGMVAKRTRIRKLAEEGVLECRIASGLCPSWDTPAVERGIILTNFGLHQEAYDELEQVGWELPALTPHWRFAMGYVLTELERFSEGLEHLEEVIRVRPDYALAYRYAAHCAFRSGDGRKGREYAKTARRLGDSTEFDAWERGGYRARQ